MNERHSNLERYQIMTPQERNTEMKGVFELLPDFDAIFENGDPYGIEQRIKIRKNSELVQDLTTRLKDLLSFAKITSSFKSYIIDRYDFYMEFGVTKGLTEELEGKVFVSDSAWNRELFQWDNAGSGGIFDERVEKGIEVKAYNSAFREQLMFKNIDENIEKMNEGDEEFKEIIRSIVENSKLEKLFLSGEELEELAIKEKEEESAVEEILEKHQRKKELVMRWRDEFIERYGDEP